MVVVRSTDWLAVNTQFSPDLAQSVDSHLEKVYVLLFSINAGRILPGFAKK